VVVQTIQLGDSFFPYRDLVNFHPPEHLGRPFRFSEPVFPIAQGYAVPPVVCEPVYRLQVVPQRQSRGHPGVLVYDKKAGSRSTHSPTRIRLFTRCRRPAYKSVGTVRTFKD